MAAGDPILVDLTGATFIFASAEAGVIIQSEERATDSKVKDIFDSSKGYTVGTVYYDFKASISFNAIVNGTTGLAAAAPGVALTFANSLGIGTAQNGVASGGIYVQSARVSQQPEDLRMVSGTAVQRAGVA